MPEKSSPSSNNNAVILAAVITGVLAVMAACITIIPDLLDRMPKPTSTPGLVETIFPGTQVIPLTATPTSTDVPTGTPQPATSTPTDTPMPPTPTGTALPPTVTPTDTPPPTATPTEETVPGLPQGYRLYDDFASASFTENWKVEDASSVCRLNVLDGDLVFECFNKNKTDQWAALQAAKMPASITAAAAQAALTEPGGYFQLTTRWQCPSEGTERAYHLMLGGNTLTASEFYPQESWRENRLGEVSVDTGQPYLLQIEATGGSVSFMVNGKTLLLKQAPDFPACLAMSGWGMELTTWQDRNRLNGQVEWIAFKP